MKHLQVRLSDDEYDRLWAASGRTPRQFGDWARRTLLAAIEATDQPSSKVVAMRSSKKGDGYTAIEVPNEIAKQAQQIMEFLSKPGGLEAFKRLVDSRAEEAMAAIELRKAFGGSKKSS